MGLKRRKRTVNGLQKKNNKGKGSKCFRKEVNALVGKGT